jgi:uridylate kinase
MFGKINPKTDYKKTAVISLGGSLIVPDEIDTGFLKSFIKLVKKRVALGDRLVLITGGGKICRRYQKAAGDLGDISDEDNDWVGIHVTRLNAQFLRILLGGLAYHEIITDPAVFSGVSAPVAVAAGWKPGWSTDFDAVELAKVAGAKTVVNLSNIDFAYDKDPKKYPDARKIEKISWKDFRKLIPEHWDPGLNSPFDPIASKNAEAAGLSVAIMNGRNFENLNNYLDGKEFVGTLIS